jgi:hypothetical protein
LKLSHPASGSLQAHGGCEERGDSIMTQSTHHRVAELHNLAAHAHAAAATAHNKGDHLRAHELTKQAYELSMNVHKLATEQCTVSADFKRS